MHGTVTQFDAHVGLGIITATDGRDFPFHCTQISDGTRTIAIGTAVDFTTFHVKGGGYRADPKHRKQPPPAVKQILADVQYGRAIISKYPVFKDLECILSEIDPDGWAAICQTVRP